MWCRLAFGDRDGGSCRGERLWRALFGSVSHLTPAAMEHLWRAAGRLMVLTHHAETPYISTSTITPRRDADHPSGVAAVAWALSGSVEVLGGCQLTIIKNGGK
jgi:hypothetical protein